ncbi:MAG: VWA domain-containing protein, partial [Planctomycetaceae bacterium]|nr:VWA domain-containing protein [Planctomycetaceae bacterium]
MKITAILAAPALCLLAAPAALAQGIILPERPRREPPTPVLDRGAVPLEVRTLDVRTSIRGRVATTVVDQVFFNPSASELEGTYLFPLPEGAAVERFSMWVDGTEMAGELLDARRAREIYESIVRSRRDPALLEFLGTRLFRASIFPIPPRSEKRVKLSYSEVVTGDAGTVTWRFPLGNARHAPKPVGQASLVVEVLADRRLTAAFSPTHRVDVVRKDDRSVKVSWEEKGVLPDQDFTLILQEPSGELGFSFAAHHPSGEDGTFLLLLAPAVDADAKPIPRDVVLCLDTSGSMAGEKIEQARNALRHGVRSLNPGDRFAVVTFATEPRRFREALLEADAAGKEEALKWIDGIQAVGGTCIDDALQASLDYLRGGDPARPGVVLFLTDGLPTIGERDPALILKRAAEKAAPRVRLFAFGVGHDVNTHLLDRLAEDLRGARDYVAPKEDIELKVSALVSKTTHPVMTDVTLSVEGVAVHDLYPRRLPDLFRGSELSLLGRFGGSGPAVVRVKGNTPSGPREFVNEIDFPARTDESSFLGRLWATRRVGHLMDEIRLHGETLELKEEVVRLAKRYGILTPWTSYLVLENEEMLARFRRGESAAAGRGGGDGFGLVTGGKGGEDALRDDLLRRAGFRGAAGE